MELESDCTPEITEIASNITRNLLLDNSRIVVYVTSPESGLLLDKWAKLQGEPQASPVKNHFRDVLDWKVNKNESGRSLYRTLTSHKEKIYQQFNYPADERKSTAVKGYTDTSALEEPVKSTLYDFLDTRVPSTSKIETITSQFLTCEVTTEGKKLTNVINNINNCPNFTVNINLSN